MPNWQYQINFRLPIRCHTFFFIFKFANYPTPFLFTPKKFRKKRGNFTKKEVISQNIAHQCSKGSADPHGQAAMIADCLLYNSIVKGKVDCVTFVPKKSGHVNAVVNSASLMIHLLNIIILYTYLLVLFKLSVWPVFSKITRNYSLINYILPKYTHKWLLIIESVNLT